MASGREQAEEPENERERDETPRGRRFLAAFNDIEHHLKRTVGNGRFGQLLAKASEVGMITPRQREFLQAMASLRNAISHEPYCGLEPIAEPVAKTVDDIERFREQLLRPRMAMDILVPREVVHFQEEEPLQQVLDAVRENNYSQFPIYDDHGAYRGLLTTNAIARWVADICAQKRGVDATTPLGQVLSFIEPGERAVALTSDATVAAVVDALSTRDDGGLPPLAVILTQTGGLDEPPLAVAVADDLHILVPEISI